MSARVIAAVLPALLAGCAPPMSRAPQGLPVTADARAQGAALAKACEGRDGWSDPAPPARIHGNTFHVGTCGITAILIASDRGHALIDTGPADAAPAILANVRALGFDPRDIRNIFFTHEHHDHMGGLAALAQATGGTVWSSARAGAAVETGTVEQTDPQTGIIEAAPAVTVGRNLGMRPLTLGDFRLTPVPSPGHTIGGTSWSWRSCERQDCLTFAFVDSLSAVSRDGYRFSDHPDRVAPFRRTFAVVARMPCDILLTTHPAAGDLHARLAGLRPLRDPGACRAYAAKSAENLDKRLAAEATGG